MFEKKFLNVYSIIVGSFFLISGIGKALNTALFSQLIYSYGFKYLMVFAPLIVLIEIVLGLALILLINPKRHSFFAFLFLIIFTVMFLYANLKNGVTYVPEANTWGEGRPIWLVRPVQSHTPQDFPSFATETS